MFAYMLEGKLTVDYGTVPGICVRGQLGRGDGVSHFGRNTGAGTVRILRVYIGADGVTNVIAD
ncbi:MAG: hypothetical protein JNL04_20885 [Rhodospirillaceae bacterium]|nr:hypothetical protein [Rhodospirillaceae bacterium]